MAKYRIIYSMFEEEYKKLNKEQKEAVDTIDGPVMVIAGPGTGKTQVLSLRIANILQKTDIGASGVLCLTFTRSGVRAMRERLTRYIGATANEVRVSTFHSFAIELVEKYYLSLGFVDTPRLIDEKEAVFMVDNILHGTEWKHLRPRNDPAQYFSDIRSLISLLKRENMTPDIFEKEILGEIKNLSADPENISSRGPTKGEIKKEVLKKIESLERTLEVVKFYQKYEEEKSARALMDYDDVLEYAVTIAKENEDAQAEIREDYQYVLVDEHQDSTGVQNAFLKAVWGETERPNIFVVGDDRQLIYGFGGAKLDYFEEFKTCFGRAHLITLVENYRSTEGILSLADTLLTSNLAKGKLKSNRKDNGEISLFEYDFPRDEIIGASMYFKNIVSSGGSFSDCVILVPKNYHVRGAIVTLKNYGIPVLSNDIESFFESKVAHSFIKTLRGISNPNDSVSIAETIFDEISGVSPLRAHRFFRNKRTKDLSIDDLLSEGKEGGMFAGQDEIQVWGKKLASFVEESNKMSLVSLLSFVGNELLMKNIKNHDTLLRNAEVLRTVFHLAEMQVSKNPHETLGSFVEYLERLDSYNLHIPIATFSAHDGVSVMTLHRSKGLEFENVWIAHMNEETLMSSKKSAFTLPESLKEKIAEKDKENAKRELYVAITRAKKNCVISYSAQDYRGSEMNLAEIIQELGDSHFIKKDKNETEKELLSYGEDIYTRRDIAPEGPDFEKMIDLVRSDFFETRVSVSLLNNFFECPWRWYFRNFLQLPEIKSDSLALGSAVHYAIECILKDKNKIGEDDIKNSILESFRKEGVRDERTLPKLVSDAVVLVKRWVDNSLPNIAKDFESERPISHKDPRFPELNFFGKIDLTENMGPSEVSVTDFKTGSPKTSGVIEKGDEEGRLSGYMRQLAMYSFLVRGAWKKDVISSKLYFLEADKGDKNMIYATRIGDEEIDLLVRDIEDYNRLLETGEWTERPCYAKSYNGGECEHCRLAREVYRIRE